MYIPFGMELKGSLNPQALDRLVARHEALRTCFLQVDEEPVRQIGPAGQSRFELIESTHSS
jgi:hypothetical protein